MQQAGTKKSSAAPAEGKISNSSKAGIASLIVFVILLLAWIAGFSSRLFAVIRFESIIHEFDPWFNYRATAYMVKHGFYNFLNWFDERAWYPLGRIVGGTVYPGLMITSGSIHYVLHLLHINVHIRDICVFLAPVFSGLTAISTYLLTKELWSVGAGLFAACFIAIVPGYISRSVAGSYDNEGIAIFALQFTYYLWIKSVKTGSVFWAVMTSLSYFYMVSAWGGYVFIINLIPLHVFVLLLMGRFSNKLFTSYTTFYILGLIMSMQIPFVGFQPIRTSEHMAASGVFALIIAVATLKYLQSMLSKSEFKSLFIFGGMIAASVVFLTVVILTYAGYIAPWSGRFYSLWDTGYAKIHIPIIASVSEHQPTTWFSFFFDLHVLVATFPAGLWYCIRNINDERVFVVLYALSAVYFAGVMVRLMLTLTPVVCMLGGIAFSALLNNYLREDGNPSSIDESEKEDKRLYDKAGRIGVPRVPKHEQNESDPIGPNLRSIVIVVVMVLLMLFAVHCTWVTSNAYSSPSIVLASYSGDGTRQILDDFREAYFWLSQNTADEARVMSWWDYGYQIAGMANRTTLVDNNTWNNSHIALVGKAMSSNESAAYEIMTALDVDYVLVIFGGVIGYSGDDINKFLWMVRIAEGEHPKDIRESDYFTEHGEFRVDAEGSPTLLNCLMYKLSYYRFGELKLDYRSPAGFDRTRNAVIGNRDFQLTYLEEAYTTEHWLVRIYRVKKPDEFNRPRIPVANRVVKSGNFASKKNSKRRKGTIRNKPVVVKGEKCSESIVSLIKSPPGREFLYDANLLKELDWSSVKDFTKPSISNVQPGEDWLLVRPLKIEDYDHGFLKLLSQLTKVGSVTKEEFIRQFYAMKSAGGYYVTVIEDTRDHSIIGSSTLITEFKFIHECSLRARLEDVVVNNTYRGKQLGKLIVLTVSLLAKRLGCYKMSLDCKDNLIPFYKSIGYRMEPGNANSMTIRYDETPPATAPS